MSGYHFLINYSELIRKWTPVALPLPYDYARLELSTVVLLDQGDDILMMTWMGDAVTKWGSCNPIKGHVRLNTELAKKPRECLEYIVVHEMVHLLEPSHNERFQSLMNQHLSRWRELRARLNRLPVRHEEWGY